MTSYPNQPYSVHLHRNGQVEIIYAQPTKSPHASAPRHTSANTPSASPRSTAATFGSSNTRIAASTHRESPQTSSSTRHRVSESSSQQYHHHHQHHSSDPHRSSSAHSGHHSSSPSSGERHRHNSTSRLDKPSLPIPIPVKAHSSSQSHSRSRSLSHSHTPSPQGSPKQTRFATLATVVPAPIVTSSGHLAPPLSHSYQTQVPVTASPHRSPKLSSSTLAVPVSRHKPSSSADSFFFLQGQARRPKGWYNRRGDHFVQRGVIKLQPKHLEWHPTFDGYPEPGAGWMDENGHFMPYGGGILKN